MTLPGPSDQGSAQECAAMIREARHVLVICHVDPDGDAIGSLLGMGWLLQALNIEHVLACAGVEPSKMRFLPRSRPIVTSGEGDHDLIVTVDCNSPDRLGPVVAGKRLAELPIVNIDHHVTNTLFGRVNWIDSKAAATAEMVYRLAPLLGATISQQAATCLLTGIVTDTWAFRTPNTTEQTMAIAIEAMRSGAPLNDIVYRTIETRTFAALRLWALVINKAQLEDGVVWAEVTQEDFRAAGSNREGQNGLVNLLLSTKESQVAVVLTETPEHTIDVSIRSQPGLDVSAAAVRLGGGGHPQAAGLTLRTTMAEARTLVGATLMASLIEQRVACTSPTPGGAQS
jgi:bifunctional oligoribonuclease and PAP phosphatase NrnA